MKMKRFVVAVIAAVSCLSFAACGSDTASKDENVIHIMSSGDSSANMERALVDEYNKTADVKAVLDLVTSADYQNKLQTVMSNPKSDSAPDIFFNWADALMIQYARADVSAPLDEYITSDIGTTHISRRVCAMRSAGAARHITSRMVSTDMGGSAGCRNGFVTARGFWTRGTRMEACAARGVV